MESILADAMLYSLGAPKMVCCGLEALVPTHVIRGYSHFSAVRHHLGSLQTSVFQELINWIRGLEFVIDSENAVEASAFASMARLMVFVVPKGQLNRVSIDCAQYNGSKNSLHRFPCQGRGGPMS
jgi:hypothetical protein